MRGQGGATWAACLLGALLAAACSTPQKKAAQGAAQEAADLDVRIHGNESISSRSLRRAAGDELIVLGRAKKAYLADDAAYLMEEYYRDEGYHDVRVRYRFDAGPPPKVFFLVNEGPRATLGDIAFEGRGDVPLDELLPFFEGARTTLFLGKRLYSRSNVEDAVDSVRAHYRSNGYLNAEVDPPEISFREKGTLADVRVFIRPGIQYILRKFLFDGFEAAMDEDLMEIVRDQKGTPYYLLWLSRAERAMVSLLRMRGFWRPDVEAKASLDHGTGDVEIHFSARTGPMHKVGRITFSGQEQTREDYLYSLITIEPGERFDAKKLSESTNRLYRTGIFTRVDMDETAGDEPNTVDIHYTLKEGDVRNVDFMAGYGSYELLRGSVRYADRNLWGKGFHLSTRFRASFRSLGVDASLSDPYFLNLPLRGTVDVFTQWRRFPLYTESSFGGSASVLKNWWTHFKTSLGYSYTKSKTHESRSKVVRLGIEERLTLGSLFTRWILDHRDSLVRPTSGSVNEIGLEFSQEELGSDLNFHKITGRSSWLFPLDRDAAWVLAANAQAGVIVRGSDTGRIPYQLRFFNGGEDSVRSFKQDELGPQSQGDPLGGEYFSTGNLELRVPLYERFRGALFADAGNVIQRRSDIGLHKYRYALGLGVRYELPIGPIRLDWGWNPNRRSDEDLWNLHLSVGFAF